MDVQPKLSLFKFFYRHFYFRLIVVFKLIQIFKLKEMIGLM